MGVRSSLPKDKNGRDIRKLWAPSFSEKSNKLVFEESLRQAEGLLQVWKAADKDGDGGGKKGFSVLDSAEQCAVLSLHVISAAGFGVPQLWPHQSEDVLEGDAMGGFGGGRLMGGHTLSLKDALQSLLKNIIFFAFFKPSVLGLYFISSFSLPRILWNGILMRFRLPSFQKGERRTHCLPRMSKLLLRNYRHQKTTDLPRFHK